MGKHAIAATFNREGIPTFGKGRYWQRSYIAKILGNPATVGTFVPHTVEYVDGKRQRRPAEVVEGYFPAVVPKADFERVQALKTRAPRNPVVERTSEHLWRRRPVPKVPLYDDAR